MSDTEREVVHRITSEVYHIANTNDLPACNTHGRTVGKQRWVMAAESEMEHRELCDRCAGMGPTGKTRRELIDIIRSEIPEKKGGSRTSLGAPELSVIADRLGVEVDDEEDD